MACMSCFFLAGHDWLIPLSSYPYPLFGHLDTTQRAVLFMGAALTMTGSMVLLQWLYGTVNGLQGEEKISRPNNIKAE
jgi:hypothetical protein